MPGSERNIAFNFFNCSASRGTKPAREHPETFHVVSDIFPTTLSRPWPELHGVGSILRAPGEPVVPGRDSICFVSALWPIAQEGCRHGQLALSVLPPPPWRRAAGLAVLAAGGIRTQRHDHANRPRWRSANHRRTQKVFCALAGFLRPKTPHRR